jgi:hypothetical protein
LVREFLSHRQYRERTILEQLVTKPGSVGALAAALYHKADPFLKVASQRNVLAHLLKLREEGLVEELPPATDEPDYIPHHAKPPGEEVEATDDFVTKLRADSHRRFGVLAT